MIPVVLAVVLCVSVAVVWVAERDRRLERFEDAAFLAATGSAGLLVLLAVVACPQLVAAFVLGFLFLVSVACAVVCVIDWLGDRTRDGHQ